MTLTEERAYLGGFIDGEGSIQIARGTWNHMRRGYTLHLGAKQVDPRPLEMLSAHFGGRVIRVVPTQPNRLAHYRWGIVGRVAERALRALRPYLVVKAGQADLALQFRQLNWARSGRVVPDIDYAERDSFFEALRDAKHMEYAS